MRLLAALVIGLMTVAASTAHAERRMALVIGNADYAIGPLGNPLNDSKLVAAALEEAGFEVSRFEDLTYRELQRTVVGFGRDLGAAGEDTVGMIFYAGHAVQANGENYLIPIDADLQDELDLDIQTLAVSTMMRGLETAGNRLNLVVLDACRNNPFKVMSRSGTRGLAKIDAPYGTLLAYSTAPGDVASDGSGTNSPYSTALAKAIRTPGLPVEQVFKQVRINVMERTANKQVPWESSSLTGDFYFLEKAPEPAVADESAKEIEFWKSVAVSRDVTLLRSYLAAYPNGTFRDLAEQTIAGLEADQAAARNKQRQEAALRMWDAVKDTDDVALLQNVADSYPETVYAELARVKIQSIEAVAAARSQAVAAAPAPAPPPPPPAPAQPSADVLFWESIKDSPNKASYEAYLARFPNGTFVEIAKDRAANGYTPPVAALTPGDSRQSLDGKWLLTVTANGSRAWKWCRAGEKLETEITISNGKFSTKGSSSFGTWTDLAGKTGDPGELKIRLSYTDNRYISYDVRLMMSGDRSIQQRGGKGQCPVSFSLSRIAAQ